jgi:DNA modification methylase
MLKIVQKPVDKLIPYVNNSRTHSDEQIAQIASSIKEFGWTNPILVDGENGIIAGHGRLMAARKLGYKEVPTIELKDLTETQRKAYIIADNRLALNAGWDNEMLTIELNDLLADGFALEILGFDTKELGALLEPEVVEGLTDEDAVPEVPEEPKTKLGDIYQLGNHRLMCGDSTSIDAVDKLMDGQKADMVFTDPPYNVEFSGQLLSNTTFKGKQINGYKSTNTKHDKIKNDALEKDKFQEFITDVLNNLWIQEPKAWYFTFCDLTLDELLVPMRNVGFTWKSIIVWKKNQATLSAKDYKSRYEPIIYGCKQNAFYGERYKQEDIWEFQRTLKNDLHPTMKPIPLIENALSNSSNPKDIIIDLFGGSGSTLIACEKQNRHARLMELDPKYCDVIVKRWEDFTGKKAVLLTETAETA